MPETQQELNLDTPKPQASAEEVVALEATLQGRGWVFAKQLQAELGIPTRTLRAIANESDGSIISGQKGYRLLDATVPIEEADRAATWLESQSRRMLTRAQSIRRRYHKYARTGRN